MRMPADDRSSAAADEAGDDAPFSIGHYIKTQRELRNVSIDELGQRTRIPTRSLERLEAGAFDGEPDGFVRGFVRTVAEGLGLDPDDTLVRMLSEPAPWPGRRISGGLPPSTWLVVGGALAVVIAAVLSLQIVTGPSAPAASEPDRVLRRDPVRALAEAYAASAVDSGEGVAAPAAVALPEVSSPARAR
jgi:hypothetical protein